MCLITNFEIIIGIIIIQVVGSIYTHHQKCVIVDTQDHGNNRKITAFLGGLDLCDGRYDTPEHRLFRDINTVFHDDYHNPTLSVLPLPLCFSLSQKHTRTVSVKASVIFSYGFP